MVKPEFNLLDEPWIRVVGHDCAVKEVSITDLLLGAHEFTDLSGELPTQDFAMLRLLLAILHAVFERVDENGSKSPLIESDDPEDAIERWAAIWRLGKFPERPVLDYLDKWRDRFWLFHGERPFYQSQSAKIGTEYTAAKLNGAVSESNNKMRLFLDVSGKNKQQLSYAEAARWLLFVNGYDDTSSKAKGKDLPSPGAGWLGKIGPVYATGDNLFETLMLNLTLLKDGESLWEENPLPVWEREQPRGDERIEIAPPENSAELLTLQSRRLLLKREDEAVVGYYLLGGEFFDRSGAFSEQLTVWRTVRESKNKVPEYFPRRHDSARQFWRDFGAVFKTETGKHQPGIVKWYLKISEHMNWTGVTMAKFKIASVGYGSKDFFITDNFSDSLSFHAGLITKMGEAWQERIINEIDRCEKLAYAIGIFETSLAKAAGGKNADAKEAKEQLYSRIDFPFRRWLQSVDPASADGEAQKKVRDWQEQAKLTARRLGDEMIRNAGESAFAGREIKEKINGRDDTRYYSAPEAYNSFLWQIDNIYKEG